MNVRAAVVIGIAFLASCGSDSATGAGTGVTSPNGDGPCPDGFVRDAAQPAVCREIVPAEACAAGTDRKSVV